MRALDIGRKLKQTQTFVSQENQITQPVFIAPQSQTEQEFSAKVKFKWNKNFILVPFTVFVLIFGTLLGTKFINFAHSVSQTPESNYAQISNGIGAALGNKLAVFKSLDQSNFADAIRGKRKVNVLMLGYGGDGHDGGDLTDSIMVLSFDFSTNKIAMISVPRDTWVKIPSGNNAEGYWKVNAAYVFGGGTEAKEIISEITGLRIDYYVALDFNGFKDIVDTLGGVQINVDNAFTDNSYPTSDALADGDWCIAEDNTQTNCRYKTVHFDAGLQFMDGERTLEYVRSRHADGIEGSDFARSKRQQKLMIAIEKKALSLGMDTKILQLMDEISGHIKTDMSVAEIEDMGSYLSRSDLDNAKRISTDDQDLMIAGKSDDGQYILTPQKGIDDYSDIQTYISNELSR